MAVVTLSSKNQITVPVEMVRSLGLGAGSKLIVIQTGDHLALFPEPADYADYIVGSMKGFWGTKEEIDRYVAEERGSWSGGNQEDELDDALAADPQLTRVYGALPATPGGVEYSVLRDRSGLEANVVDEKLSELKRLGAVREVPPEIPSAPGGGFVYRRVRE
jgi:AbrB family looped-hinge helix DNA binding protein